MRAVEKRSTLDRSLMINYKFVHHLQIAKLDGVEGLPSSANVDKITTTTTMTMTTTTTRTLMTMTTKQAIAMSTATAGNTNEHL